MSFVHFAHVGFLDLGQAAPRRSNHRPPVLRPLTDEQVRAIAGEVRVRFTIEVSDEELLSLRKDGALAIQTHVPALALQPAYVGVVAADLFGAVTSLDGAELDRARLEAMSADAAEWAAEHRRIAAIEDGATQIAALLEGRWWYQASATSRAASSRGPGEMVSSSGFASK